MPIQDFICEGSQMKFRIRISFDNCIENESGLHYSVLGKRMSSSFVRSGKCNGFTRCALNPDSLLF